MINEYSRTELLIGSENMEKLKKASVASVWCRRRRISLYRSIGKVRYREIDIDRQ